MPRRMKKEDGSPFAGERVFAQKNTATRGHFYVRDDCLSTKGNMCFSEESR